MVLNQLDNVDKHRRLNVAFVYPGVDRGIDLIEIIDRTKIMNSTNLWHAGQPLDHGTKLARFMLRGEPRQAIRVRRDAVIAFASGELSAPGLGYTDMIDRVRGIADRAATLMDMS